MHRKCIAVVLTLACVVVTGCKKDAQIESVIAELHSFSEELTKKVQSNLLHSSHRIEKPGLSRYSKHLL